MKLIVIIVLGVILVTFAWGWLIQVSDGLMSARDYTKSYWQELNDQSRFFLEELARMLDIYKKHSP